MSAPIGAAPRLLLSPPGTGKTEYVLAAVRARAARLTEQPVICVPTPIHKQSARQRLGAMGGALGVHVFTFDELWAWILNTQRLPYTEPVDAALFRLMEHTLARLSKDGMLQHFASIAQTPGLAEVMRDLVLELENALIPPDDLLAHWQAEDAPPRLIDIARIYQAWRATLAARGWVDRAGVGWMALDQLRVQHAPLARIHTPFYFDGFDFLTELQVQTIAALATCADAEVIVTLTGNAQQTLAADTSGDTRFHTTRRRLEAALGIQSSALPATRAPDFLPPLLRRLHEEIIAPVEARPAMSNAEASGTPSVETSGQSNAEPLVMLEATQRTSEIRAALRWIKQAIVVQGADPKRCALVMRDVAPYRMTIEQIAHEFGVPIRMQAGTPLREHGLIGWLEMLLQTVRPDEAGDPLLPRGGVVDLWRSPWQKNTRFNAPDAAGDLLDLLARRALVTGGASDWRSALALDAAPVPDSAEDTGATALDGAEVARLAAAFEEWLAVVTPPTSATMRSYVHWLADVVEAVVAQDLSTEGFSTEERNTQHACDNALEALRSHLRALIWTAEALNQGTLAYHEFLFEITRVLDGARYKSPQPLEGVFVGSVVDARGVPFDCLALVGLAEGELPRRMVEDPFLRQADRLVLRRRFPGVQSEPYGIEREYFEETLARPERALLLTRPLLAENGERAEPSPYWLELRTRLALPLRHERAGVLADSMRAASIKELLRAYAAATDAERTSESALRWLAFAHKEDIAEQARAATTLRVRTSGPATLHDGNLSSLHASIAARFPAEYEWSPTAFEAWINCHFFWFAGRLLALEAPSSPEDGVARWQIGQVYHAVLAEWYAPGRKSARTDDALDAVIARHLHTAPAAYGFLDTPAWQIEAREIADNLRATVAVLDTLEGEPVAVEKRFARDTALLLTTDAGTVRVRGYVDRIDRLPSGKYRVIDYKTGKAGYDSSRPLAEGKRLQLALYALAVEQAEGAGSVADGRYFFVHTGEAARWSLASFEGGIDQTYEIARAAVQQAAGGIRAGNFVPMPPDGGCPDYCPAAAWCWHYQPRGYGR